ncbi:hypothetical protein [Nonomuraea rhodomycinica]|uniref:Uncharacterized protein n=1 Tax=Nonomuraea rhodomycinica TaxID=1712872 RepID=A0A7Y6IJN9_9ACTN|nr:hypothetical protein [Nonomuraea rhodomycinica]NUW39387.1 hypothetical protein [Nonomuraea rhodomycinica]
MGPFSVMRWVRAAGFAATCAVLATLGHLAGGGSFDPKAALGGVLLLMVPALALTGRERVLGEIVPATALSQVVLHALLGQGAAEHPMPALPDMAHLHHQPQPMSMSTGMLVMHALGVLVTSAWLRWAEAGLCALVRQLAGWVLRPLLALLLLAAGWAHPRPEPVAYAREDETARVRLFLRHALVRRGPPGRRTGPAAVA